MWRKGNSLARNWRSWPHIVLIGQRGRLYMYNEEGRHTTGLGKRTGRNRRRGVKWADKKPRHRMIAGINLKQMNGSVGIGQ
jgi:hypothetical protein